MKPLSEYSSTMQAMQHNHRNASAIEISSRAIRYSSRTKQLEHKDSLPTLREKFTDRWAPISISKFNDQLTPCVLIVRIPNSRYTRRTTFLSDAPCGSSTFPGNSFDKSCHEREV
jgi:hypothetical protein